MAGDMTYAPRSTSANHPCHQQDPPPCGIPIPTRCFNGGPVLRSLLYNAQYFPYWVWICLCTRQLPWIEDRYVHHFVALHFTAHTAFGHPWSFITFWPMERLCRLTQPLGSFLSPVVRGRTRGGSGVPFSAEMASVCM